MAIRLGNNVLLCGGTRELGTLVLLDLDLLLGSGRGRVSQLLDLLPFLVGFKVCLDGSENLGQSIGDGGLEVLGRENVLAVIGVDLLDRIVDEGFAFSALDDELGLTVFEGASGKEDVLDEAEDTIVLNDLGCGNLGEVMLAFWKGT